MPDLFKNWPRRNRLPFQPDTYPDGDQYPTIGDDSFSHQIPVVDLKSLLHSDQDGTNSEVQKLHFAAKEWDFFQFQMINHGVSTSLLERVKSGNTDFFHLPMEEKDKYRQEAGDVEGYGQAFVLSEEHKLDWMVEICFCSIPQPFPGSWQMREMQDHGKKGIDYSTMLGILL